MENQNNEETFELNEEVSKMDALLRNEGFSDLVRCNLQYADDLDEAVARLEYDMEEIKMALALIEKNRDSL